MKDGVVRFIPFHLLTHKFEVHLSHQKCCHAFADVFCEGLPQTDPFPAKEGSVGHRVSLFPIGAEVKFG